jgi:hypothetical protein
MHVFDRFVYLLLFGCSCTAKELKSFVYIYEWPDNLINRWPIYYTHKRLAFIPNNSHNYGLGEVVNSSIGQFDTHQYALFSIFYHRLLQSDYVTKNPDEAKWFFIPYDVGMDSSGMISPTHTWLRLSA